VKGPETYLETIGVRPSCAMHADQRAVMDPAHRAFVNHEVFFFSTRALRALFLKDPLRWCGVLTDPVSGERFQPDRTAPRADHEGRPYYFLSPGTLARFRTDPTMYADARRAMPKPAVPPGKEGAPAATTSPEPTSDPPTKP